jgi:gamma-glutamylcyclotransferase (GGCT)/AIG2-like uncharacterized protein YtfP
VELPESAILTRVLAHANAARRSTPSARSVSLAAAALLLGEPHARDTAEQLEQRIDRALGQPSTRLAAYGSLRPGAANHREVAGLGGRWSAGRVRGRLIAAAPATGGYPMLTPDAHGEPCAIELLESLALPDAWPRLDAFEGPLYLRELALVELSDGALCVANLYVPARR